MYEARRIAEDLLLTAARVREGDAEEIGNLDEDAGRRVVEVLVSYAERIVEDLGIDPEIVWTPDVLREGGFTDLGTGKQRIHTRRFVVTVAYDPDDVEGDDPGLFHLIHQAGLENGPEVAWDMVAETTVEKDDDESTGDIAFRVHNQ